MARSVGASAARPAIPISRSARANSWTRTLFNGDYYQQKVRVQSSPRPVIRPIHRPRGREEQRDAAIAQTRRPQVSIRFGCLSDGVIGAWMAAFTGLIFRWRRKKSTPHCKPSSTTTSRPISASTPMPQRPGYAMGHEPGLLFAVGHAAASQRFRSSTPTRCGPGSNTRLPRISLREGFVDRGPDHRESARAAATTGDRNPWNEYECGNWYARAMSSYALLGALSGFRYSAVDHTLHFGPKLKARPFVASSRLHPATAHRLHGHT